jgi:hypothetical protein
MPLHLPLQVELHLPWQFGLLSVLVPSDAVHMPLHSPVHVDWHLPLQLASISTVPSQYDWTLQLSSQAAFDFAVRLDESTFLSASAVVTDVVPR